MPYHHNADLPDAVKNHLPPHAQDLYREAFNHAYQEYQDPQTRRNPEESLETISHRVAWHAVKTRYQKGSDGHWHPRSD